MDFCDGDLNNVDSVIMTFIGEHNRGKQSLSNVKGVLFYLLDEKDTDVTFSDVHEMVVSASKRNKRQMAELLG